MSSQSIAAALLAWYTISVILLWQIRATADSAACERSGRLVTVLQYAPYTMRAADMGLIAATIDNDFDVDTTFFETDGRTTNRFNLAWYNGTIVEGETNWMSFRIVMHDASTFRESCMSSSDFAAFDFVSVSAPGARR